MKSKNQIAQNIYGCDFDELTGGEKAAVTRKYDNQTAAPKKAKQVKTAGYAEVKFGRPGVNGVKTCLVADGTSVGDAEKQVGMNIDYKKEGFVVKTSNHYSVGQILKQADLVYDGDLIMVVPGVDSAIE
jgi:hypothetical protein